MKKNISIATVFIWIGFVGAISFMEAWMKFRAPGVTLPIGLGIGRLVFSALNKMELGCLVIILYSLFPFKNISKKESLLLGIVAILLLLQTLWTLPTLDQRAIAFINETPPHSSNIHFIHIISEVLKICALFGLGFQLLKHIKKVKSE